MKKTEPNKLQKIDNVDTLTIDHKYTIEIGTKNGVFINQILRHNEEWIKNVNNIEGGNVITAMFYEILELKTELEQIKKQKQ